MLYCEHKMKRGAFLHKLFNMYRKEVRREQSERFRLKAKILRDFSERKVE